MFISVLSHMAEYFSDKQIIQFKEVFNNFDKNKDGDISADELKYVLKSLGQKVKIKYCKNMIKQVSATRCNLRVALPFV